MPIIQADYARRSGLTRGRVSQLVKAGMPLEFVESCDAWRCHQARLSRKPPPFYAGDRLRSIEGKLMSILEQCRRIAAQADTNPPAAGPGANGDPLP
jgi:hypothetical protein